MTNDNSKKRTLADVFLTIAADHGVSRSEAIAFFMHEDRRDVFDQARSIPVSTASAMLGQPVEKVEMLIRRDIERMFPRVH